MSASFSLTLIYDGDNALQIDGLTPATTVQQLKERISEKLQRPLANLFLVSIQPSHRQTSINSKKACPALDSGHARSEKYISRIRELVTRKGLNGNT